MLAIIVCLLVLAWNWDIVKDIWVFYTQPSKNKPVLKTLDMNLEHILRIGIVKVAISLLIIISLPIKGEALSLEEYDFVPRLTLLSIIAGLIVAEDLVFRVIPWAILAFFRSFYKREGLEKANVILGTVSAIIFGAIHITNYDNPTIWTYLGLTRVRSNFGSWKKCFDLE